MIKLFLRFDLLYVLFFIFINENYHSKFQERETSQLCLLSGVGDRNKSK